MVEDSWGCREACLGIPCLFGAVIAALRGNQAGSDGEVWPLGFQHWHQVKDQNGVWGLQILKRSADEKLLPSKCSHSFAERSLPFMNC